MRFREFLFSAVIVGALSLFCVPVDFLAIAQAIEHAPLAIWSAVAIIGAAVYFGGLSRHAVLASVNTVLRVRDRAFRQHVLSRAVA